MRNAKGIDSEYFTSPQTLESMKDHSDSGTTSHAGSDVLQIVSFKVNDEEYGVDILKVREINRTIAVTRVPNAPEHIDGVINLRGKVIPVIDLRTRFGLPRKSHDNNTRIIVVELDGRILGFVVDSVQKVLRLDSAFTESAPGVVNSTQAQYIRGVAKHEDRLIILLNIEGLLSAELDEAALAEESFA